jgi:hypothetical protein
LQSQSYWYKNCKSKNFPKDIPSHPPRAYKNQWENWGSFLGTGRVADQLREFKPYNVAKKYAQSLGLKNQKEWFEHTNSKNFPIDIKKYPPNYKEHKSWGDFLGTGTIADRFKKFKSYEAAKKYAQSLKLKNRYEWKKKTKSKDFPKNIPMAPENFYKTKKTWKGWSDFFGNNFRSYNETRKYVISFNFRTVKEWRKHTRSKNFPKDIPKSVKFIYKNSWKGWPDFFGNNKWKKFQQAKNYAQSLKLKGWRQWMKKTKSKNFPKDIPVCPDGIYKKQWKNWPDFLGYIGRKPRSRKG